MLCSSGLLVAEAAAAGAQEMFRSVIPDKNAAAAADALSGKKKAAGTNEEDELAEFMARGY